MISSQSTKKCPLSRNSGRESWYMSGERGFRILIFRISYYCSQEDLLPWIIKLWTYKIVRGNIYYYGRINEYQSTIVGERIFYNGISMNYMKQLNSEMQGITYYH